MPEILVEGQKVTYQVRRSPRARRVRLEIRASHGLTVVVPRGFDEGRICEVIAQKLDWIQRHLQRLQSGPAPEPPLQLRDGQVLLFRGEPCVLRIGQAPAGAEGSTVSLERGAIHLLLAPEHRGGERAVLEHWMRQQAQEHILQELKGLSEGRDLRWARVQIRQQKTRWGSCSGAGTLSFNWRLVLAPPTVLRYVVAHELAHLKVPRHSPEFWALVRELFGDPEGPKRWLKEHSAEPNPIGRDWLI